MYLAIFVILKSCLESPMSTCIFRKVFGNSFYCEKYIYADACCGGQQQEELAEFGYAD